MSSNRLRVVIPAHSGLDDDESDGVATETLITPHPPPSVSPTAAAAGGSIRGVWLPMQVPQPPLGEEHARGSSSTRISPSVTPKGNAGGAIFRGARSASLPPIADSTPRSASVTSDTRYANFTPRQKSGSTTSLEGIEATAARSSNAFHQQSSLTAIPPSSSANAPASNRPTTTSPQPAATQGEVLEQMSKMWSREDKLPSGVSSEMMHHHAPQQHHRRTSLSDANPAAVPPAEHRGSLNASTGFQRSPRNSVSTYRESSARRSSSSTAAVATNGAGGCPEDAFVPAQQGGKFRAAEVRTADARLSLALDHLKSVCTAVPVDDAAVTAAKGRLIEDLLLSERPVAVGSEIVAHRLLTLVHALDSEREANVPINAELLRAILLNVSNVNFAEFVLQQHMIFHAIERACFRYLITFLSMDSVLAALDVEKFKKILDAVAKHPTSQVELFVIALKALPRARILHRISKMLQPAWQRTLERVLHSSRQPGCDRRRLREVIELVQIVQSKPPTTNAVNVREQHARTIALDLDAIEATDHQTIFSRACRHGDAELVSLLLKYSASTLTNVNRVQTDTTNALQQAAARGHFDVVKLLCALPDDAIRQSFEYECPGRGNCFEIITTQQQSQNAESNDTNNNNKSDSNSRSFEIVELLKSKVLEMQSSGVLLSRATSNTQINVNVIACGSGTLCDAADTGSCVPLPQVLEEDQADNDEREEEDDDDKNYDVDVQAATARGKSADTQQEHQQQEVHNGEAALPRQPDDPPQLALKDSPSGQCLSLPEFPNPHDEGDDSEEQQQQQNTLTPGSENKKDAGGVAEVTPAMTPSCETPQTLLAQASLFRSNTSITMTAAAVAALEPVLAAVAAYQALKTATEQRGEGKMDEAVVKAVREHRAEAICLITEAPHHVSLCRELKAATLQLLDFVLTVPTTDSEDDDARVFEMLQRKLCGALHFASIAVERGWLTLAFAKHPGVRSAAVSALMRLPHLNDELQESLTVKTLYEDALRLADISTFSRQILRLLHYDEVLDVASFGPVIQPTLNAVLLRLTDFSPAARDELNKSTGDAQQERFHAIQRLLRVRDVPLNVEATLQDSHSVFSRACAQGDVHLVSFLLSEEGLVSQPNKEYAGMTSLMHAVAQRQTEVVHVFVRYSKIRSDIDDVVRYVSRGRKSSAISMARDAREEQSFRSSSTVQRETSQDSSTGNQVEVSPPRAAEPNSDAIVLELLDHR